MRFLLHNSVLQRVSRSTAVADAVRRLVDLGGNLCSSPASVLEAGYSARTSAEHDLICASLTEGFEMLPLTPDVGLESIRMQRALSAAGQGRAVGVFDLLHGACAVAHEVTLVHYDHDFELLAELVSELRQQWVVPRGSVD